MAGQTAAQLGISAPSGGFQDNGWYGGRNYDAASQTFGDPGQAWSGNNPAAKGSQISTDVISQSNPQNLSFLSGQMNATDLQAPVSLSLPTTQSNPISGLSGDVAATKAAYVNGIDTQKQQVDANIATTQTDQNAAVSSIQDLSQPFRQNLETQQRNDLYVNQNFQKNQDLANELDTLLTQGNDLIKQQQSVTGLSAIRNPRIQQTMSDIQARAGVIQAVMAARNSQISVAENMIDRSVNAIQADRQDQISYYKTIVDLTQQKLLKLDDQSTKLADAQLSTLQDAYTRAADTADYVKKLMINPDYASLLGSAGVTLNDSVDTINAKLKQAQDAQTVIKQANDITAKGGQLVIDPKGIPKDQLVSFKGPDGTTYYYQMPGSTSSSVKPGSPEALSSAISEMTPKILGKLNSYGDISPQDWQAAMNAWLGAGFKKQDFIDNYGQYADTNRGDFKAQYGFDNPNPQ